MRVFRCCDSSRICRYNRLSIAKPRSTPVTGVTFTTFHCFPRGSIWAKLTAASKVFERWVPVYDNANMHVVSLKTACKKIERLHTEHKVLRNIPHTRRADPESKKRKTRNFKIEACEDTASSFWSLRVDHFLACRFLCLMAATLSRLPKEASLFARRDNNEMWWIWHLKISVRLANGEPIISASATVVTARNPRRLLLSFVISMQLNKWLKLKMSNCYWNLGN